MVATTTGGMVVVGAMVVDATVVSNIVVAVVVMPRFMLATRPLAKTWFNNLLLAINPYILFTPTSFGVSDKGVPFVDGTLFWVCGVDQRETNHFCGPLL